jgi:hypothetical protein
VVWCGARGGEWCSGHGGVRAQAQPPSPPSTARRPSPPSMAQRGLPLLRAPGVDSASNRPSVADPATGGGGGRIFGHQQHGSSHRQLRVHGSCHWQLWRRGSSHEQPRRAGPSSVGCRAQWAFLFIEIIYGGGLLNSTTSVNSITRGGCLTPPASVNRLTEAAGQPPPLRPY